jgi:putative transposase
MGSTSDGHSAVSAETRLGLGSANLLHRWKGPHLLANGPALSALESRVQNCEKERRVEQERDARKKNPSLFQPKDATLVCAVIARFQQNDHPTAVLCKALDVHHSRFYSWQRGTIMRRAERDADLTQLIREAHREHRGRYGARRIARELGCRGHACGVVRVRRLPTEMSLRAIQPKSHRPRTNESRHRLGYSHTLLLNRKPPMGFNLAWARDVSYVPLQADNLLYLSLLMDLYSRHIVAWNLRAHMQDSLILGVLREAVSVRQPQVGLVHHIDHGGQHAGKAYRLFLARAGMRQSMNRADDCYDTAFTASCLAAIKRDIQLRPYDHLASARRKIDAHVRYYKNRRVQSSTGHRMPPTSKAIEAEPSQRVSTKQSQVVRNELGGSDGYPAQRPEAAPARNLRGVSRAATRR